MEIKENTSYTVYLNREEFLSLMNGIGSTSPHSREKAGMSKEHAIWFSEFYDKLSITFHKDLEKQQ